MPNHLKILINNIEIEQPDLSIDEMMVAVEIRRRSNIEKDAAAFQCVVTDNEEELSSLLNKLRYNLQYLPDNTRFQVIHLIGEHWTTMDFNIVNGHVDVLLFDAAGNYQTPEIIDLLHRMLPDVSIANSCGSMQKDGDNCATFAFDIAYQLSKIKDLHQKLSQFPSSKFDIHNLNIRFIPIDVLSEEFGPVFRNTQSLSQIARLVTVNPNLKGNQKFSMEDYLSQKERINTEEQPPHKKANMAIHVKCKHLKEKINHFARNVLTEDEYVTMQKSRAEFTMMDAWLSQSKSESLVSMFRPATPPALPLISQYFLSYRIVEKAAFFNELSFHDMIEIVNKAGINHSILKVLYKEADENLPKQLMNFAQLFLLNRSLHDNELKSSTEEIAQINNKLFELITKDQSSLHASKVIIYLAQTPMHELNQIIADEHLPQFLNLRNAKVCQSLFSDYDVPFANVISLGFEKRDLIFNQFDSFKTVAKHLTWQDIFDMKFDALAKVLANPKIAKDIAEDAPQTMHRNRAR